MNIDRRKRTYKPEKNYDILIENIKDYAIFIMDKKGGILSWNQGAYKQFGYKAREVMGKHYSFLFMPRDAKNKTGQTDMRIAKNNGHRLSERQYARKDNKLFWGNGVLTSTFDGNGKHQGYSKIMRDVTEEKNLQKVMIHQSTHDYLTDLPNRNFFQQNLMEFIDSNEVGDILAILFLDFNNFKRFNEQWGHKFGDSVLIKIARRLSKNIRTSDVVARLGGDEFVILARGLQRIEDVSRLADKILATFKSPIKIGKRIVRTTVSIGIALYPNDTKKAAHLLLYSDRALYKAKKLGGDQYQFYAKTHTLVKNAAMAIT
ncbi:MAG TPA: diguanylate cyclase [Patescibacteria group bacterium]